MPLTIFDLSTAFTRLKYEFICCDWYYEHYKNRRYKILAIARHSETLEELVVYQALYGEGEVWTRPVTMFLETVLIEGNVLPRFKHHY